MKPSPPSSRLLFALTILSFALLAIGLWTFVKAERHLSAVEENEDLAYALIAKVLQTTKDSNRLALDYMVTGTFDYVRDRDEMLGVFKGFYPKPVDPQTRYWQGRVDLVPTLSEPGSPLSVMTQLQQVLAFDGMDKELAKLEASMEGLVAMESGALQVASSNGVFPATAAQVALYSPAYLASIQGFSAQIRVLQTKVRQEFASRKASYESTRQLALYAGLAAFVTGVVLLFVLYLVLVSAKAGVNQAAKGRLPATSQALPENGSSDLSKRPVLGLNEEPLDMQAMLDSLRCRFEGTIQAKGLGYTAAVVPIDPNVEVLADVDCLTDLLGNLVDNAVRFTSAGEIAIEVALTDIAAHKGLLRMTVEDTGAGLSDSLVRRINSPFDLSVDRHHDSEEGKTFGLGLFASKYLADAMNGQIEVQSKAGSGSRFKVTLPVLLQKAVRVDQPEEGLSFEKQEGALPVAGSEVPAPLSPCQKPDSLKGRRIMVVDDHLINLKICARVLERRGAAVACYSDAAEAIEFLVAPQAESFDAVLMDLQMPKLDGYEALERIRANDALADLPVIAFTAGQTQDSRSELIEKGFDEVFYKPLDVELVCEALQQLKKGESRRPALLANH